MECECVSSKEFRKGRDPRAEAAEGKEWTIQIKLGFTDHPIPKYKEPLIYTGTDTRNDYTKWNVSNQIIQKEVKENYLKK